ncbi:hypothetical protein ACP_2118 [Acidobacterium capsulatum ATCC 51196]|uniref:Uncharacterized protein n=1 Tax=Acidobacterium capsulatum (strain ATCC 51196 / DSM 11244 / BCRC 80197 / JCM 7670 / NBRC 15755 / NCIMB 13165 / 161) TaxID=240015 RepID=C1F9G0_ACIC5|nr:hypothetical protein ACP_2118 [Acidobacterium capsulatum ATCC 51196]
MMGHTRFITPIFCGCRTSSSAMIRAQAKATPSEIHAISANIRFAPFLTVVMHESASQKHALKASPGSLQRKERTGNPRPLSVRSAIRS